MKQLLLLGALLCLCWSQPNTKRQLYTNGLSPNFSLDQHITALVGFTKQNGGSTNGCRLGECNGGTATTFTVSYADGTTHVFCICNDNPVMNIDFAIERFRRIPWVARKNVKTLTMASDGKGGGAYNAGDHLAFFGRNQNTEVFLHEAAHSLDRNINRDQNWINAVAADSCVPDGYAQTNYVEDFAQVTVLLTYITLAGRTNDAFFNCAANQLRVARDMRISTAEILKLKTAPPPPPPTQCDSYVGGSGSGLIGDYWSGSSYKGNRKDPVIAWDWGTAPPSMPGVAADQWSARWNGRVAVPLAGLWTFYTRSDDGAALWVNNVQLINEMRAQSATEHKGTITLAKNTPVPIKLEYFEGYADAVLFLSYSHQCLAKQVIPAAQLFPPVGVTARDDGCSVVSGEGTGLFTSFFEDVLTTTVNQGNFKVDFQSAPSVSQDNNVTVQSIRWTGAIQAMVSGDTTFSAEFKGDFKLAIDGKVVIDSAVGTSGTVNLVVGKFYSFDANYTASATQFGVSLSWEVPTCLAKQVIPEDFLFVSVPEDDSVTIDTEATIENESSSSFLRVTGLLVLLALFTQ